MQNKEQNTFMKNLSTNQFFISLPAFVQENIFQSGIEVANEEELRKIYENLTRTN